MSYAVALNRKNFSYSRTRGRSLAKQNQSRKIISFFLIFAIILFIIIYIVQANSLGTDGYTINGYKDKIAELQSNNKTLELELSKIQSLSFLEGKVEGLNMMGVGGIEYLSLISEVAAR